MSADVHAAEVAAGPMRPAVRHYPWGSHTALAALRGDGPSARPEAEWWYGAHPLGPAMLDVAGRGSALDELIAQDPDGHLGTGLVARFGPVLPFLVKLLAADEPLSLQVHPSAARAARGFADEEARGMPRDAPERRYRDTWPKPELLHALGTFDALCGLRDPVDAIDLLGHLSLDPLDGMADRLATDGRDAWPGIVRDLLRVESSGARRLVTQVVAGFERVRTARPADTDALEAVSDIARQHPDDPAVVVALLLEHHRLEVGDELATAPGVPHLYLQGCGVEVMATSDNVLRGGMTTKHVDVDEFVAVLDPGARHRVTRAATSTSAETTDPEDAGAPEHFRLASVAPGDCGGVELDRRGPQILLCTAGRVDVCVDDQSWTIGATEAIYAPAAAIRVHVQGDGRLHRVTVGSTSPDA